MANQPCYKPLDEPLRAKTFYNTLMLIGRSSSTLCCAYGIGACHYRDEDEATHSWTECLVTVDLLQVWRDLLNLL